MNQVPSPVPGLDIEAATLLVQAVKARRRYFSKQTASTSAAADVGDVTAEESRQSALVELKNTADDKSKELINELKRQVQTASNTRGERRRVEAAAPVKCAEFLIATLSDDENSFRLRRAALAVLREILVRSSDSRAFLASGRHLLGFVSLVEGVSLQNNGQDARQEQSVFQLEAVELVQEMASKFGRIYTQFTVAGRLLGDLSTVSADVASQRGMNMSLLRRERDAAFEHGPKACKTIRKMINRADGYFRVLVPRFGGLAKPGIETKCGGPTDGGLTLDNDELHDLSDDSVDWEEGDLGLEEDEGDHELAVDQTLDVLEYSGALLDGGIAIKIGAPTTSETDLDQRQLSETRQKLQVLVDKLSKRQPRLKQWILALSRADGMEERTLRDPANSASGPKSLILLSEQKRSSRSEVLQDLLSVRNEMDHIIEAAARLGINATNSSEIETDTTMIDSSRKRQCLPEPKILPPTSSKTRGRKRSRSKVKVFYKKK